MNHSFCLVWSAVRGAWAVVSELAKSHAKSSTVIVVLATSYLPIQVQAVLISSGTVFTQDTQVGHLSSTEVTEFEAGGFFVVASTNFAALKANGMGAMIDLGGGTYDLSTLSGLDAAIESQGNFNNGIIDLSKASKVTLSTAHRAGLQASKGGNIQISNLDLTHNDSIEMNNVASVVSQDLGSKISINKAKIESSTSGTGIKSLDSGEVVINELTYTSTNTHPALLVTGGDTGQMSIGSLTGTKSSISNAGGNLVTVNANGAKLTLNNIDATGNTSHEAILVDLMGGSLTTVNEATIKNNGTGTVISLSGTGTTLNLTDSSLEGNTINMGSFMRELIDISTGSMATINKGTIKNNGKGMAIDTHDAGALALIDSSVESRGLGLNLGSGATAMLNNSTITSVDNGISVSIAGILNLKDSAITTTGAGKTAVIQGSLGNQLNLEGNNVFIALGNNAKALSINTGVVSVSDGVNINLSTTDGTAWSMSNSTLRATETGQANYTINTKDGNVPAIQFVEKTVVQLGSL
ncbi:MAG: ESPR domain-containing protein, partial [Neisseriaceae bacterium]|nr:ESPR domain-containing protein [Neisseriaceae bacterium]